ncbi:MAG: chromate transporter [Burkholderiaceae bacterium]|nr:chromate transporter [Burkholderiaceae bacterium]MCD8516131.1 chromate transporter [Burkholderiaceae bacterium]MCD8536285.1 chromate transporter [Burkholderiaceae bacterium]MCD8564757.1 chromate transporter [Burkholderiaceae bacterium]
MSTSKAGGGLNTSEPQAAGQPSLWELFFEFLIIGAVSFGGGIVAYQKILLTEKKRWLSDDEFMAALAISQTMPGLNAVNLAVLSGDKLRGVLGSIAATLGLLIPGCTFVMVVGLIYLQNANHPTANLILGGVAAAATGLLSAITYKIGHKQFKEIKALIILVATFVLMSIVSLSLPMVLAIIAPIAIYLYRPKKDGGQ